MPGTRHPAAVRPSSRATGTDTTGRILDAAMTTLARRGADSCSLPRVADAAGLSTGPLYSRFDGPDDLFVALWNRSLAEHLTRILDATATWFAGDDDTVPALLATELEQPSEQTSALLELLAAVRRFPYAAEAIRGDTVARYREFNRRLAPISPALIGYGFAAVLGRMLLAPVLPDDDRGSASSLLTLTRELVRTGGPFPALGPQPDPAPLAMPTIATGDTVADGFLNAALRVIARGGYERASANRIAREAELTVSRAYGVFVSKQELAAQALETILHELSSRNALAFIGVDLDTYRRMVLVNGVALCDVSALPVRRLRLECLLAARHHDALREVLQEAFHSTSGDLEARLRSIAPGGDAAALRQATELWHMLRDFGFGVLVLNEATGVLHGTPDLSPLAVALPRLYHRHVAEPLGIDAG